MRKTVKWGGAVVTVLLLVVWIGSCWWWLGWDYQRQIVALVISGRLDLCKPPAGFAAWNYDDFSINSNQSSMEWSFDWGTLNGVPSLTIPLWFPLLFSLVVTTLAWRADAMHRRHARVGLCPSCGYDRSGLAASAVCPECGGTASA